MDMSSEADFAPDIVRENHSSDYLKMKEPLDHYLVNHQDVDSLSESSESDGQFGYGMGENDLDCVLPNEKTKAEEIEDTSLDHYIPCFVKKIKGQKPFLIDIKVAQFPSNTSTSYARQCDFRTNGGSFRNFNNSYSTSTTSSYAKQQHNFRINEGSFHDFNNSYSQAEKSDFHDNSHGGSWSFNPRAKEFCSAPYQQERGLSFGNNYRNNYGNNDRNNYGSNYRSNNGNNYGNNHGNNNTNMSKKNGYFSGNYYDCSENYSGRNNYSNRSYKNNNYSHNYSNRKKEILIRGSRTGKGQQTTIQRDEYNKKDFVVNYEKARFFMIKSFSENDVYNSVKYNVWSSTPYGNKKLDSVYRTSQILLNEEGESEKCPIFLFFSVNSSGQFVGLAEMTGLVDFQKTMDFWQQDRWNGFFPIKWHIIKDIPNFKFRDITLENNENKVVTFSRDTQEILLPQGLKMLEIFKEFEAETSLLDDFEFYEEKEKERWLNKDAASRSNDDDLFDDLSMEFLDEEMRKMSFRGPKRCY